MRNESRTTRLSERIKLYSVIIVSLLFITACGGGGGGSDVDKNSGNWDEMKWGDNNWA